ncbi:hypothetical protein L1277_000117 [Okibacterium sp. HSC-33S16]|uniref:hypothetical protein n=1 Tax=Okibacterium sp. HSC-33S16 TaxID=2910965 RepID=UPI00209FB3ED|nr:hypothetical protein [Okibacterium sp. HSC-33S16]MCP2030053.1 hypothetical protein [Okibacterium sp. HSC-33S16]
MTYRPSATPPVNPYAQAAPVAGNPAPLSSNPGSGYPVQQQQQRAVPEQTSFAPTAAHGWAQPAGATGYPAASAPQPAFESPAPAYPSGQGAPQPFAYQGQPSYAGQPGYPVQPGYPAQPGYPGQVGYGGTAGQPYPAYPGTVPALKAPSTPKQGLVGLILGIVGVIGGVIFGWTLPLSIAAVILGFRARKRELTTPGRSLAAIVTGIVGVLLSLGWLAYSVITIAARAAG